MDPKETTSGAGKPPVRPTTPKTDSNNGDAPSNSIKNLLRVVKPGGKSVRKAPSAPNQLAATPESTPPSPKKSSPAGTSPRHRKTGSGDSKNSSLSVAPSDRDCELEAEPVPGVQTPGATEEKGEMNGIGDHLKSPRTN